MFNYGNEDKTYTIDRKRIGLEENKEFGIKSLLQDYTVDLKGGIAVKAGDAALFKLEEIK